MATESHDQDETEDEVDAGADDSSDDESPAEEAKTAGEDKAEPAKKPEKKADPATKTEAKATPAKPIEGKKRRRGAAPKAAARKGFPLRNVVIFGALVIVLLLAFGILGNRGGGGSARPNAPKWKIGETVNVEITLVTPDYKNLACAMEGEIAGRRCAYLAANRRNGEAKDSREDDKLLQPYTTAGAERHQFLASGLWMSPEVKDKLAKDNPDMPGPRFTVNCKYKVEGKTKNAQVQWKSGDPWYPAGDWYTGVVTDCKVGK